ncbi:MAG: cysteine--tRNA ligase [Methanobacteriaceae archaeon]|nr:cysteine--tRNA ligase [Methanobacteriaceae archaeon]
MKIYNTMSRKKELLRPLKNNRINLFVCGPTVYDDSHIGHARTYISFDLIARYLKYKGYSLFYLQNITDIDDKIIKRSQEMGVDPLDLARKYEKLYLQDMALLGVENVNLYARATEHIPEIIKQIKTLLDKGYAYETSTGVYFDETKFEDFGKLSRRNIGELNHHRIRPDSTKRNPGDFALWKKRKEHPLWDSPWGKGRPGWHIEDTAITEEYFGSQYDIHGGGLDLIFPHHEAEIAQMEASSGQKPMVNYWMHTGFLNVDGEKMSKSLGNFITIKELLKDYEPDIFRLFVISTHYRSPIDFSHKALEQASKNLKKIRKLLEIIDEQLGNPLPENNDENFHYEKKIEESRYEFIKAMDNDFNTPIALSVILNLVRDVNRDINNQSIPKNDLIKIKELLLELSNILGLNLKKVKKVKDRSNELLELITYIREKLRSKKEWELSDEIRSKLGELDILIEDK